MSEFGKSFNRSTSELSHQTRPYERKDRGEMLDHDAEVADSYFKIYQEDSDDERIPSPDKMEPGVKVRFEALILDLHASNHLDNCIRQDKFVWPRDEKVQQMLVAILRGENRRNLLEKFYAEEVRQAKADAKVAPSKSSNPIQIAKLSPEAQRIAFDVAEEILWADPEIVKEMDPEFLRNYAAQLIDDIEHSRRTREIGNMYIHPILWKVMNGIYLERAKQNQTHKKAA